MSGLSLAVAAAGALAEATAGAATVSDWRLSLTLAVVVGCTLTLTLSQLAPFAILVGGLLLLLVFDVVPAAAGLHGFSNPALFTVAALYVVAEGIRQTGGMARIASPLLGSPSGGNGAAVRLLAPAAALSAVMNNTPVVAMLIPTVTDWSRRIGRSPAQLLLPLSYATILGGLCTVIGTSTTLTVNELLNDPQTVERFAVRPLTFFEIAKVGVPSLAVGLAFLLLVAPKLLRDRKPALNPSDDRREYTVEMTVDAGGPIDTRTIEKAGLRSLPGVYLAEIERDQSVIKAPGPETPLTGGDRLVFVGAVKSVVDLKRTPGLSPATDQVDKIDSSRILRGLIEAVVSPQSPLSGRTIREAQFRTRYNAVVIAVARNGERIPGKIGDIRVQPGDTLLLEAPPNFYELHRDDRDFLLVSKVDDSAPVRHERAWLAIAILVGMVVVAVALDSVVSRSEKAADSMFVASVLAAGAMVVTRCCRITEALRSVDISVLVTMAAGIGLGSAMQHTGAAAWVAQSGLDLVGESGWRSLAMIAALTMIASNLVTAKAAAFIILPIALQSAEQTGSNPMAFAVAVMVAAASSFATPFGYQTNLMVYGPGGYRASDFLRVGIPLSVLIWLTMIVAIPLGWPL